jgi:hypothetical protein
MSVMSTIEAQGPDRTGSKCYASYSWESGNIVTRTGRYGGFLTPFFVDLIGSEYGASYLRRLSSISATSTS